MLHSADVLVRPRCDVARSPRRDHPAHGYEAALPTAGKDAFEEQEERERREEVEARDLRLKAAVTVAAGVVAMALSMPLMSAHDHSGTAVDPFMRWVMHALTPTLKGWAPWLYATDPRILTYALLLVTVGVMSWAGTPLLRTCGCGGAETKRRNMNTLIAVGTGAAFLYSALATFAPHLFARGGLPADVYYEAVVWIVALVLLGKVLEARAMGRASTAIRALLDLAPPTARVVRDGEPVRVPAAELRPGDRVAGATRREGARRRRGGRGGVERRRVDAHRRADAGRQGGSATR